MGTEVGMRMNGSFRALSKIAGAFVILTEGVVLFGWWIGSEALKRVVQGFAAVNPATAICFVFAGVSLWVFHVMPAPHTRNHELKRDEVTI